MDVEDRAVELAPLSSSFGRGGEIVDAEIDWHARTGIPDGWSWLIWRLG